MSFRRRSPYPSPGVVDVETARRAIGQVARERDALDQQLQRAQALTASLQRQLDARNAENAYLAQAVRALQSRGPDDSVALAEERDRVQDAERRLVAARDRLDDYQDRLDAIRRERDEALAERDRTEAALHAALAEIDELRTASPQGDRAQRLAADLANLRRHQAQAIEQGVREQTDRFLVEIASVRDSVQRALDFLPGAGSAWHDGLLAVLARVEDVLAREGIQLVGTPGERFDPSVHEAVGTVDDGPEGVVQNTVSSGLVRADGTVVLPAKVIVGSGKTGAST